MASEKDKVMLNQDSKYTHLCDHHKTQMEGCSNAYSELLTELFFLQHGGNYIDFVQFKKRPSQQLCDHIRQNPIISYESEKHKNLQDTTETLPIHSNEVHTSLPTSAPKVETPYRENVLSIEKNQSSVSNSLQQLKRYSRNTLSDVYEDTIGSQEEILERAKQEAVVQRRVSELRKMGMWSQRRLPKVQEPPRTKAHWDYLLEEMRWLATDFAQERKWKRAAARKVVRMVAGYHKDVQERERKAEREEQQKLRRIASSVARQIRLFWSDIEKVVQYKQRCLLDEKRQKALDLHLNYIVDQTAKYSHWLTEGLTQPQEISSPSASRTSSHLGSDDDFLPRGASSDDEETIAFEECRQQEDVNDEVTLLKEESALPFDDLISQLPEDLVENIGKPLPNLKETSEESNSEGTVDETDKEKNSETISHEDGDISSDEKSKPTPISLRRSARKRHAGDDDNDDVEKKKQKPLDEKDETLGDVEFDAHLESSDDEATLQEQEAAEDIDHQKELADLQADNEMSIDELMKLYHGAFDKAENSPKCDLEEKMSTDSGSESEESEADASESEKQEIGMDYLLKAADDVSNKSQKQEDNNNNNDKIMSSPNKEITEVAAEAMSLQPTGHTLATTQVVTPIPSLLRHTLREYQHIGLDWLVTMYEKRLNGILADEMGLGKTIQTIALLAHLACEKGVWGPHLIVVPTSVMLNWEMELKKWCPGFKILTYYGSQKERKLKRMGWTKANAFHVCITSYKLVLQDHTSFRRKKWRYLILDEAQNIKNFKSQRWQTLLNFNSQRRLLLTGTPLQNNLMELWSLMHFLMPHVFQSHKEFKEWFSNPLTGMIEGLQEYNEKLVKRLHKVLRPFLLRRVKKDVEKQMPNKYEHVVRCHLSKRQRFLYEDFMSKASTKETLSGGHFMSVINVLMQLRKVCNHPNLFEPRPTVSSFVTPPITLRVPTLVHKVIELDHFQKVDFQSLNMHLPSLSKMSSVESDAIKRLKTSSKVIEGIDVVDEKKVSSYMPVTDKMRGVIRDKLSTQQIPVSSRVGLSQASKMDAEPARVPTTQSITLQYQTAHGTTKWATIPNGQIRQLPGGVVQIVTSSVNSRSSTPIPPAQDSIAESETEVTAVTRKGLNKKKLPAETYTRMLARKRVEKKESILSRLSRINDRRCEAEATYLPSNTISFLQSITTMFPTTSEKLMYPAVFENAVKSPLQRLKHLIFVLDRFIFVIPKVATSSVECEVAHPTPWRYYSLSSSLHHLRTWLSHELSPLHRITRKTRVQFPETRLIEYDCGKLQVLNVLLRRFWEEKHRILIFTQMTKVLDILEAFLSYHGYRYLRLDGSTHIEQRMARMERFNNDPRIFCFILSTRSGGIGVNLTGADTVVFYDSDWNPTMDAQAQDRCHRIGQTRDVHIYRLISEKTVEENILKKANQKRLLGDLAIEGGGFTTAFFQQQAIKDLFDDPSGLEELTEQPRQLTARQKALEAAKAENNEEVASEKQDLEKALLESEEKEDVVAAEMLKQEQDAVMEEFVDAEDKAGEEAGENLKLRVPKGSKVEEELKGIYQELSPVERYALHYLEESAEATNDLELQEAEAQVEQSKKDWELAHLVALKEEEERRLEEADEIFYTREGNQVNLFSSSSESSLSDEEVVKRKSKSKQPRKKPAAQKKKIVKAPSRGRGRRQSGVNRMEMKQKRTIILDAVSSSDSVCVDESYNREGDPLWREYEQETAGYLVQSDDSSDDNRWDFSSEEHIYDNELNSYEYRESPLWRVAEETEKSIHNSNFVNESSNVDYGPCEITSFSKSGRPRKRNKRLCEDEFEVFSPGSGFSDSTIPFSAPKPKEAVYNVVVETDKSKLSKQAVKPKKNPIISLKSLGIKANMTTNLPSTKPVPSRMTSNQRSTVILPFSFVQANAPVRSLTPMQARFANPVSTISPIRFTANVVQAQRHNNQTIVIQQTSLPQISQMKIVSTSSQSVIANSNSSHTVNSVTTYQNKAKNSVKPKPRENLFDLDFMIDTKPVSANASLFDSLQEELNNEVSGEDDLITLNLEPVSPSHEDFLEPSNEEERNVFESFASLLQS